MKTEPKKSYEIVVGETGNEIGHVAKSLHVSMEAAVRKAKKLCSAYDGDGWWLVRGDCGYHEHGGRR